MTELILLMILVVHFIADFVAQTDKQAKGKSTDNIYLFEHVASYTFIWMLILCFILSPLNAAIFVLITFTCHFLTDYFTSRAVKHFFSKGDHHNGFIVIGFDQILHYVQLYLTIKFLL